jgi:hypothetical protein
MNIISESFGLVANAPWNPSSFSLSQYRKLFKSTQTQPAQSSRINDIEHTILLVTKPKLAYI